MRFLFPKLLGRFYSAETLFCTLCSADDETCEGMNLNVFGRYFSMCEICLSVAVVSQTPSQGANILILAIWNPDCYMKGFLLGYCVRSS